MTETKNQLQTLFVYLFSLIRNPVQEIQKLPEIGWKTLLVFQFCLTFTSVIVSNVLAPYAISLPNILISLVAAILATGLVSLFFYYFFLILYDQQLKFIKIFTLVLFAHIPFAIFHLASFFFPPADLIGLGISGLLMVVGLVENFSVPRKLAIRLMIACYLVYVVYWISQMIVAREHAKLSTPQSLDTIEKEIQTIFEK
ncbi:MAG: hypothetical protein AAF203_05670 [Pseudomonadota bacterium]